MANAGPENEGRTIRSVEITFDILDTIREQGTVGVTELADELDHSKSTIHSHLRTLEEREILVRQDDGYRMSLRVLDMATHVRKQIGNYDVIRSEVDTLAEETGETVQFGMEEHGYVAYLYKMKGERGVESASRVGARQPIYSTGLGKTILAYMPEERAGEIIRSTNLEALTSNTIASESELRTELERIRERGYGIDDEENVPGLRCVASPVTASEDILGAVSVSGPSSRFSMERIHDDLSEKVKRAANVIELNTKFA